MKTEEPKPVPVSQVLEVDQAAMTMARKWRLIRPDGTVKCANDWCGGDATLPTLECRDCREARKRA